MELNELLDRFQPDVETIETGKKRQAQIWRNEKPDCLPILMGRKLPDNLAELPRYNMKECWYDKEKMLWNALLDMIAVTQSGSDSIPSMRANLGCGIMASVFGCKQLVFEDKMPWVQNHLSREEIRNIDISDSTSMGDIPRVLEYMEYFVEMLDGRAAVYCSDVQGPFDTAHLVFGDEIFMALYDEPDFVHGLLDKVTRVYIDVVEAMKRVNGEKPDEAYHYNNLYVVGAGTRTSEDTTTLIAPNQVKDFALPYTDQAFEPFGGGYVHYCGNGENIRPFLMRMDSVRGLNFGDPQKHDMAKVISDIIAVGKVYYGNIPRENGEDVRSYFARALSLLEGAEKGLIFTPVIKDEDGDRSEIVDLWRSLQ